MSRGFNKTFPLLTRCSQTHQHNLRRWLPFSCQAAHSIRAEKQRRPEVLACLGVFGQSHSRVKTLSQSAPHPWKHHDGSPPPPPPPLLLFSCIQQLQRATIRLQLHSTEWPLPRNSAHGEYLGARLLLSSGPNTRLNDGENSGAISPAAVGNRMTSYRYDGTTAIKAVSR